MDPPPEGFAKGSVIVADQILWDAVPWKRLSDGIDRLTSKSEHLVWVAMCWTQAGS
jgi:hypothetical protein